MASPVTHAIIGTAGHIDHGKTALIKALTGQDTDRLKEEKARGISIDLGFAHFTLPDGTRAGVIDVPGHERFIRNMLAGAHGIDLVLFTIAADDGVMPQSEEHLDILHLLGTARGIFVITKADLAGPARLDEVAQEIELLAEGTRLAGAPIVPVSSTTGEGLDELRAEIARQLDGFEARRATGIFRLPLDRAFVIKGHGTVVTGTAMGAEVRTGDRLRVLPGGGEVRVRSIQVHGETVERAGRCQRVALNLTGTERIELQRGCVLADWKLDLITSRLDAALELRPAAKRPLRTNARVRFFIGTTETMGRVILLEPAGALEPRYTGVVQLVLDDPVLALCGDRFVIRDETNLRTLGGGVVLNPIARRVRKPLEPYLAKLNVLRTASGAAAIEALLGLQENFAITALGIAQLLNTPQREVENALNDPRFVRLALGDEAEFTTRPRWEELKRFMLDTLAEYHRGNPLDPGMEMEAMRERLPYAVGARGFRALVDRVSLESELVREESTLRVRSHRVQLGASDDQLGAQIERALKDAGFQPPDVTQLGQVLKLAPSETARLKAVLATLERQERLIKVASDLYYERAALEAARTRLIEHLRANPEITAATYRDLLGASRRFAIALLDYFDHCGLTARVGDARHLRAKAG